VRYLLTEIGELVNADVRDPRVLRNVGHGSRVEPREVDIDTKTSIAHTSIS